MRKVSIKELRCMKDKEGLVLQGCGGDLQEWENGINDILTDQNILDVFPKRRLDKSAVSV